MPNQPKSATQQGILLAIAAYTLWGIAPVYFKWIAQVPPLEILSHRIIWSFILLLGLVHVHRQWRHFVDIMKHNTQRLYLLSSAIIIAINWLTYIWAVNNNHMLDASLGYYINPLFNVLLGMIFLGERLRKLQWFAVLLATLGVAVQLVIFGSLPLIALILASSFGVYGLLRKKVAVGALVGLFIETLILVPAALVYLFWLSDSPTSSLLANTWDLNLLLIAAGLVTTLPLICFTSAATKLPLSTLGFFQYIGPCFMFLLAVLVYGEAFTLDKALTFLFIWLALIVFSFDGFKRRTLKPTTVKENN